MQKSRSVSLLCLRRNPSETRGHLAETCWMRDEPSKQSFTTTRSLHGLLLLFHPGCVWVHDNNTMTDNHCSSFRAGSLAISRAQNVIPKSLKKVSSNKKIPLISRSAKFQSLLRDYGQFLQWFPKWWASLSNFSYSKAGNEKTRFLG